MRLIKLSMVETDGAMDGVIRTFDTDIRQSDIDLVVSLTDDGSKITSDRLATAIAANDRMIVPTADHKIASKIDNGWGEKRIMFAMVVEVQATRNSSQYEYIVGYTDKSDPTYLSGRAKFDPDMKLFFNSITRVHMTGAVYRGGSTIWQPSIKAHDQILNRSAINGTRRRTELTPASLRPTDLFNRKGSESAFGSHLRAAGSVGQNTTGSMSQQLRASSRENNDPARYLHRSLTAYGKATSANGLGALDQDDEDTLMASAADLSPENILDVDPVLERMRRDTGILDSGYVTFGELMDMNPDFDEDTQLPFTPFNVRKDTINLQDATPWNADTPEGIAAYLISISLPAVMIHSMYSKVDNLILNTRARMGEPRVLAGRCTPFIPGLDATSSIDYFESTLEHGLLRQLSHNGMMDIDCTIDANIDQDIEIWISIDGGPEEYFAFAAHCDSLVAPTLTDNIETVDLLADDIVKLASKVVEARDNRHPSHVNENRGIDLSDNVSSAREDRDRRSRRDTSREDRREPSTTGEAPRRPNW